MSKIIKELYYHISGTPTAEEIKLGDTRENYIRVKLDYDLGGYSMLTYQKRPRGYYITFSPIGRGKDTAGYWESYGLFNEQAHSILAVECARQSKKSEAKATAIFDDREKFLKKFYPELTLKEETQICR